VELLPNGRDIIVRVVPNLRIDEIVERLTGQEPIVFLRVFPNIGRVERIVFENRETDDIGIGVERAAALLDFDALPLATSAGLEFSQRWESPGFCSNRRSSR
jgi:hypothetical protein